MCFLSVDIHLITNIYLIYLFSFLGKTSINHCFIAHRVHLLERIDQSICSLFTSIYYTYNVAKVLQITVNLQLCSFF